MIRLQRWESGPYFTAFSLHIPDMRVEIVKICPRSPTVLIEPVFRYRTPKSGRLPGEHEAAKIQPGGLLASGTETEPQEQRFRLDR
jgi:hypothetical protein